ncbi:hypothetical protein BH09PAT3_BH09PAT3_5610 [soil metagenome]
MAEDKPTKTTKRRLRAAPSQTVREQATQGQAASDNKPVRNRRLKAAAASSRKPFARAAKLFDRQPFKTFAKIGHVIGLILVPRFVRGAFAELRQVTWPNRQETRQLTTAVIMFAIAFGIIVTVVDYGLDKLFKAIILK